MFLLSTNLSNRGGFLGARVDGKNLEVSSCALKSDSLNTAYMLYNMQKYILSIVSLT